MGRGSAGTDTLNYTSAGTPVPRASVSREDGYAASYRISVEGAGTLWASSIIKDFFFLCKIFLLRFSIQPVVANILFIADTCSLSPEQIGSERAPKSLYPTELS